MAEGDLRKAAQQALGKPYKIKVIVGTPANVAPVSPSKPPAPAVQEEVMQRAMSDPAIQSFREAFPDAEIRQVRNLKEGS